MVNTAELARLFSLEGKTALVTGASGGIGRSLSVVLAAAGAAVGLSGTNRANLEETLRQVEASGGKGVVLPADLSSLDECRQLVRDTAGALGGLDILVNNAGMNRRKRILEFTEDDYEKILAVNLRSVFFLTQQAHPFLKAHGSGKVLNIGSMTSYIGLANVAIYGMTKSALAQLTRTMAVEWAADNIQVNCLAPGFIRTPLTEKGVWSDEKISKWILNRIPAGRAGTPEDLVGTALFLCSPASAYVTGQLVAVDGGFLAGGDWNRAG